MKVNPDIFFKFHGDKFIVWNYRAHEQFELTLPYVKRLYEIGTGSSPEVPQVAAPEFAQIDRELADAGVVSGSYTAAYWGWDTLSHIFHFGTNSTPSGPTLSREDGTAAYIEYCEAIGADAPVVIPARTGEVFELPPPDLEKLKRTSLWDALLARRTTREFTGEPIDLAVVSDILHATFGAVHGPDRSDVDVYGIRSYGYRRTSPAGGGLQTAEPYLVNFTISGLPTGIYHYHSIDHKLTRIEGEFPAGDLGPLLAGQNFANDLGFAIFMVARFDKMWWKYPHSR
ncbi:MAG TPA: nitroreductase family protein, partial [Kofleriaceae bacterium]